MLCSAVTEAIFSSSQPGFLFSLVVSLLATGCRLQFSLLPSRFQHLGNGKKVDSTDFLKLKFIYELALSREFEF